MQQCYNVPALWFRQKQKSLNFLCVLQILWQIVKSYLSSVSSSRWLRSQAMYSRAASVTLGHQDRSNERNLRKFSAISSIPSSVILEHPDSDKTVKLGRVWTEKNKNKVFIHLKRTILDKLDVKWQQMHINFKDEKKSAQPNQNCWEGWAFI